MYRVRSNGSLKTQGEIRKENPNTSFPKVWTAELVEELGLDPVFEVPTPTVTRYQIALKDGVEVVNGKWCWKWSISEMSDEDKAAKDKEAADSVRLTRDQLIADTDWVVIKSLESGQPVAPEWVAYRQALRDVPEQIGFPYDITWPVKPS